MDTNETIARKAGAEARAFAAKYPELAKLEGAHAASHVIQGFLEWLGEQRIDLCNIDDAAVRHARWAPITESYEKLVARHLGIDLIAVENERRALLAQKRQLNEQKSSSEGA